MAMAAHQASGVLCSSTCGLRIRQKGGLTKATLNIPNSRARNISLSNLSNGALVKELELSKGFGGLPSGIIEKHAFSIDEKGSSDSLVLEKLYAILEAVADRVEMHKNIGEQRDNWNSLLLTSINTITLAAATMSAVAATSAVDDSPLASLKMSSSLLYLAATGMLVIMNKIQPSQLAEEQRNAARLFQQLHIQIERIIRIGTPTDRDVKEAMEKVLALDKAYPLPLLGAMLDKFPSNVEPAVWWPQQWRRQAKEGSQKKDSNGWNGELEEEMRKVVDVATRKDKAEYLRLGGNALKLNKLLAISGPFLTGLAAVGSAFVGSPSHGSWAAMLGIGAGALASVVNTVEHGGQVGMVFEMYRGNAGFFKLMEESIDSNLTQREVERRENGELFEMKVALQLGRSLSELRELASDSSSTSVPEEFASKLF